MNQCVLCFQILAKKCDSNLVFGKGKFSIFQELETLEFTVETQKAKHICQSCLRLLKKRRGLIDSLRIVNSSIANLYSGSLKSPRKRECDSRVVEGVNHKVVVLEDEGEKHNAASSDKVADNSTYAKTSTPVKRAQPELHVSHLQPIPAISQQTPVANPPVEINDASNKKKTTVAVKVDWPRFFSRLSSKKSLHTTPIENDGDENDDDLEDLLTEMNERELEEMHEEVMNEMLSKHPLTYDSFNICEMAKSSTLSKFTIQMLHDICEHFEIDISAIQQRRRSPYVDLLMNLVKSCSCEGN
ncbi:hypothetical protein AC249_AIPGENE18322 [Exaiptasia diaphana]|nr:hypothetical protein AC249_AIPGENE18322 [Exaiptasia diaphana]